MSEGDTILVTINEDIQQSIEYIRSNYAEALEIPFESFGSYASGVDRDGERYTAESMRGFSEASAKVWDLLDRMGNDQTTDETMLAHIQTLRDVAEKNRNGAIWGKDGTFDSENVHGFTCPENEEGDELCDSSDDEEDDVIVVS